MALLSGLLAVLITLATLAYGVLGLFTGGGVFIALVIAHAVGTIVASLVVSTERSVRRLASLGLAATIYVVGVLGTFAACVYVAPGVFASRQGLILALIVAYIAGTAVASFVEPAWRTRTAGLLALFALALALTFLMVMSREGQGGPNTWQSPSRRPCLDSNAKANRPCPPLTPAASFKRLWCR